MWSANVRFVKTPKLIDAAVTIESSFSGFADRVSVAYVTRIQGAA